MIQVVFGDLFASHAQTWVNPVNCKGVMGKGLALGFRQRFPEMYQDYQFRCRHGLVELGYPYLFREEVSKRPWILNFPTKLHWRNKARVEDIVQGLQWLQAHYQEWGITWLAIPALGCGEGGLEWRTIGPILYQYLAQLQVSVDLYAPRWERNP